MLWLLRSTGSLKTELLRKDTLFQGMTRIEEKLQADAAFLANEDLQNVPELGVIGDGADGPLSPSMTAILTCALFERSAAPAPRAERAYRREREKARLQGQDRTADRKVVGRTSCRCRDEHPVANEFAEAFLPVYDNRQPRALRRLAEQMHLVDGERVQLLAGHFGLHPQRVDDVELRVGTRSIRSSSLYSFMRKPTEPRCMP